MLPLPPRSPLFPYTTLFRSRGHMRRSLQEALRGAIQSGELAAGSRLPASRVLAAEMAVSRGVRSEEHTSELQSRRDLVCRLLLEKKKKKKDNNTITIKYETL